MSLIRDKLGKNTKYFIWIIHFFDKNVALKNFFYFFIKKQFFNVSLQPCLKQKKNSRMALAITSQNFEETIQSPQLVMIDFWATWCGPCRALAPTIEELAEEYKGKMVVAKCDIDENNEIAVQFGIMSIPTVLFIKNGEVVEKQVGLVPKANLKKIIDSLL